MTAPRKLIVSAVVAVLMVGGVSASPAGAELTPLFPGPLACHDLAATQSVEAWAYEHSSWPEYAASVLSIAYMCRRRFVPVDPWWAQQEAEWWVNLTWLDYAQALGNAIKAHHFRVVPR